MTGEIMNQYESPTKEGKYLRNRIDGTRSEMIRDHGESVSVLESWRVGILEGWEMEWTSPVFYNLNPIAYYLITPFHSSSHREIVRLVP